MIRFEDYSGEHRRGGFEAPIGIEPMYKGFADLSLTTWVRRLGGLCAADTLQNTGGFVQKV